jgi:phosphatidyl-myo-inositol alpha-mannosyltransferase
VTTKSTMSASEVAADADRFADTGLTQERLRIGIVCPYDWAVPGGVKTHVRDLAETLMSMGHFVSVLAPVDDDVELESYVVSAGSSLAIPYNGSVARIKFDPKAFARTRQWLREGQFDVLHIHEPTTPSPSVIAAWSARGPVVGTFHTSNDKARANSIMMFSAILQPALEKVSARIAVSEDARRTLIDHFGGDAILVPNGVRVSTYEDAKPLPQFNSDQPTLVFLGRVDEPRKGLQVLLAALPLIAVTHPDVRLLVAGPGDHEEALTELPAEHHDRVVFLGKIAEADKGDFFATGDVYVAPNTGGESFGIVLLEAMASRVAVLASDIDAFVKVLGGGAAGALFDNENPESLAAVASDLLSHPEKREQLVADAYVHVQRYDWDTVAREVLNVYESVRVPGQRVREDFRGQLAGRMTSFGRRDRRRLGEIADEIADDELAEAERAQAEFLQAEAADRESGS